MFDSQEYIRTLKFPVLSANLPEYLQKLEKFLSPIIQDLNQHIDSFNAYIMHNSAQHDLDKIIAHFNENLEQILVVLDQRTFFRVSELFKDKIPIAPRSKSSIVEFQIFPITNNLSSALESIFRHCDASIEDIHYDRNVLTVTASSSAMDSIATAARKSSCNFTWHYPEKEASYKLSLINSRGINADFFTGLLPHLDKTQISRIKSLSSVKALELYLNTEDDALKHKLFKLSQATGTDAILQNNKSNFFRLIVFDMDSTLIRQEVIDEIARRVGVVDEVAVCSNLCI